MFSVGPCPMSSLWVMVVILFYPFFLWQSKTRLCLVPLLQNNTVMSRGKEFDFLFIRQDKLIFKMVLVMCEMEMAVDFGSFLKRKLHGGGCSLSLTTVLLNWYRETPSLIMLRVPATCPSPLAGSAALDRAIICPGGRARRCMPANAHLQPAHIHSRRAQPLCLPPHLPWGNKQASLVSTGAQFWRLKDFRVTLQE